MSPGSLATSTTGVIPARHWHLHAAFPSSFLFDNRSCIHDIDDVDGIDNHNDDGDTDEGTAMEQ